MYFSSIPEAYAPVGAQLRYTLTGGSTDETVVRILADGDRLLGTKRFTEPHPISFDAAPYLRNAFRFTPQRGRSGVFTAADRLLNVVVEASCGGETIRSLARPCVAADCPFARPSLLTVMPANRLLTPDGCDELTLFATGPLRITVTAEQGDTLSAESYAVPTAGLYGFRVAAADFAGAERLTVDLGACGSVSYTVLPAPDGARTVAWRSRAGSIEHYTFPVVQRVERRIAKRRACGAEGLLTHAVTHEERVELQAAYEVPEVCAALADLLAAEQVWWLDEAALYRPIDVLTEQCELHRHGSMRAPVITVRSTLQHDSPWSC